MIDIVNQISAAHREIGNRPVATGEGRSLLLRRTYDASVEDVWDACTDPARLSRWLGPVTGDFRLGGTYQLEGNASGKILLCEAPRLLAVTWSFGGGMDTEVEVRLADGGDGGTLFELEHSTPAEVLDELVRAYGPGGTLGVGAGWDLTLLALDRYLRGEDFDPTAWEDTPEAREFAIQSCHAWGAAVQSAWGTSDDDIAAAIEFATQQFTAEGGAQA
jgi:uncharacterized protein YndB with AHSA1/START domain